MLFRSKHDSGVSSEEEGSEEDLPHYRASQPPQLRPISMTEDDPAKMFDTTPSIAKRANLMDTINKLSAIRAECADKKSTLDQLFGNPSSIAQT